MSITSGDLIAPAQKKLAFINEQVRLLRNEAHGFDSDIARLSELLTKTRDELASYLLAEVSDEDLEALQDRLRYPSLIPLKRDFEVRLEDAKAELTELETQDDVTNFDFHLSRVRDEIAEIADARNVLAKTEETWTSTPIMETMLAQGYFSSEYSPGLLARFKDWVKVSYLMEALEDLLPDNDISTPALLRAAWQTHREEADPIFVLWRDLHAREAELVSLGERVAALRASPQTLFDELYRALSDAVLAHLDACPEELLMELAAGDKHLVTFLKKSMGVTKQVGYLRELKVTRIDHHISALEAESAKLERKINKFQYKRYKPRSERDLASLRRLKEEKWAKRHRKNAAIRTKVSGFHKYQKGSFRQDYLWWDVMSGRARADDLYEVRHFRETHSDWDYRTYDDGLRDGVLAAAAMDVAADALTEAPSSDDEWAFDGS